MQPIEVRTETHQDFGPHTYGGPKNVAKFMQRNPFSVVPPTPRRHLPPNSEQNRRPARGSRDEDSEAVGEF
ncbi:hypothetical protein ACFXTN_020287 [Malus domestica]